MDAFFWGYNGMNTKKKQTARQGIALIAAMIFIIVFAAISVGFLSLSSANTQIADNHRASGNAMNAALSGLELMRYWCSHPSIAIPGMMPVDQRYGEFIADFKGVLNNTNIPWTYNTDTGLLTIGSSNAPINISTASGSSFYAETTSAGTDGINIVITGQSRQLTRKLSVRFAYGTRKGSVFDFGVATKEPLYLKGGTLTGSTVKSESDVYIDYFGAEKALQLVTNKSEIAGSANIVNPNANITAEDIKGKVGGLSGQDAIDNAIDIGVTPTEFPYPDAAHFEQYATGGYYTSGSTLENKIIKAGTNPKFTGNTTITGVLYIESPNVIDFGGNVTVKGMIVAEGDWTDNSETNKLSFTGSVNSQTLPTDAKFDTLRQETGTFLLAPGFALSFGGSFGTLNGAIAGNGIQFSGNAGGTVKGSVINYSGGTLTKPYMTVEGSSDIVFNRSGITKIPAGFVQEVVIHYDSTSYSEVNGS
jgi:cytoskeletal protein CcmA (bactofilin family)